jgi:hypothetical protein
MIVEILNGGEIQAQESTEYLVFADTTFVLPASQIKNTIKIKVSGVINISLKFTYPNETQRTIGIIKGTTYKPELNSSLVYTFTLEDQTEMELKSYKRLINTYWTPYITEMPINQGLEENPQVGLLGLVNPENINSTDDIPEGENNLYFTEQRAIDSFSVNAPITLVDGTIGTTLTQYTDEDARDAVGLALQNGNHTGISFVNADAQDKINATVSLSSFSIGDLGDVLLGGLALQNNHFLKYSNGKWINSTLSSTNLSDINSLMKKTDNLAGLTNLATARTNLGLGSASTSSTSDFLPIGSTLNSLANVTFVNLQNKNLLSYDSTTGKWTNRSLSVADISDINKIYAPINNPTFTGSAKSTEPLFNSNDNTIATTGWVRQIFSQGGGLGGASQLNDLTDVQVSALQIDQVLKYDGAKFVNAKIAFTDITGTDGLLKKTDNLAGLTNLATARTNLGLGSASLLSDSDVLTKNSPLSDLSDISFSNLESNQFLKYDLATNRWSNAKIKSTDIEGVSGIYAPINSPAFTGTPTAPAPANNSNNNQIATTSFVRTLIAEGGGGGGGAVELNDLLDVSIDTNTQVAGQTLRFNGVEYVNSKLASSDLSNSANVVLVNTAPTFITQAQGDNSTKVATTAFVQTAIGNINGDTIDAIISSAGFNNDGSKPNYSSTAYILNTDSLLSAIGKLDTQASSNQAEVNTTQTSLGLNANGSRPIYSSNNYILNTDSHHVALGKLDAEIKANSNSLDNLGTASLLDDTDVFLVANAFNEIAGDNIARSNARTNLGLGTSAIYNVGTANTNVVQIGVNGLPAISGQNLTALPSIDKLSDVDTTTNPPVNNQALVYNAGIWNPSSLSTSLLTDANNLVFLDQNQTITGNKTFTGNIDFTGSNSVLVNTDIDANGSEVANASFVRTLINLAGGVTQLDDLTDVVITELQLSQGQTLKYNHEINAFVNDRLSIDDLSDVDLSGNANGKILIFDGVNNKFIPSDLPVSYTDEDAINAVGQNLVDNNLNHNDITFSLNAGNIEASVSVALNNIAGVIINNPVGNSDVLKYNGGGAFTNSQLSSADLSDVADLVKTDDFINIQDEIDTTQTSLGLNGDGSRPVYSSTHYIEDIDSHHTAIGKIDTALFNTETSLNNVIDNLGTASAYDIGTANNHLPLAQDVALLGRAINSFTGSIKIAGDGTQSLSLFNGVFPMFSVSGNGNVLSEGTLQVSGTSNLSNIVLQPGRTIQNLLGGQVSFGAGGITTTGNLNAHDITASGILSGNSLTITTTSSLGTASANTPNAGDNSTRVATTAFVQNELSSFSPALNTLSDVILTDPVANEVLLYNGTEWINSVIDTNIIQGLGTVATLDTTDVLLVANNLSDLNNVATARDNLELGTSATLDAGTQAGNVLLMSVNDTLPILSGVNLTGVLKTTQAGAINGIATLDAIGKLSADQIPAFALTTVVVVVNEEDKPVADETNIGYVYIVTSTSKSYISDGNAWIELLSASDLAIASAQAEIDSIETAVGLAINGSFIPFVGTNYLNLSETITGALTLLDTQIKSNTDTLDSFGNIVTLDTTDVFQVANTFSEIAGNALAQGSARTNLGLGTSATYNAGTTADTVLLLDGNGAIDATILDKAGSIGGVNIDDIITVNDNVNNLIDIPTLKNDLELASTDLTDSDNLPRLDAVLNSFIGDINADSLEVTTSLASDSLTVTTTSSLAEAYATTPNLNDDSTRVATTAWVVDTIGSSISNLSLDELSDVNAPLPLENQVLLYDGEEWINSAISTTIISGLGTSATYNVGTGSENIVLLDNTGAISSVILDRATSIGGLLITDILTSNSDITSLIDIETLKGILNLSIDELIDVNAPAPNTDDVLFYDGNEWVSGAIDVTMVSGLGSAATYDVGTNEGEVAVWGPDGQLVGATNWDYGFIIDDPIEQSFDFGSI